MTTTQININEILFADLTLESAENFQGGGMINDKFVQFTKGPEVLQDSGGFNSTILTGPVGGTISLSTSFSSSAGNNEFRATIKNMDTKATNTKVVNFGDDITTWTGLRGDKYQIFLADIESDINTGSAIATFV
ncbi:hypothetical protein [Acaryochloris sp. IP29b_bin.148]|uniref:hypothetical protein n=1 Tax=Acaryochloris sp. IP29b_bin.148 TaxID=2969218 RepID=UPI002613C826|nr:hypothetical protein [Acaryochloris sp. IP29b_bin.148]